MKILYKQWHYHPELELVLSIKSRGTLLVGDSFKKYDINDIILLGKNLAHMYIPDMPNNAELPLIKRKPDIIAEDYVVHFNEDFLGESFFDRTEMRSIDKLIKKARYGIKFSNLPLGICENIKRLISLDDFDKTILFLKVLYDLSKHDQTETLVSIGYNPIINQPKDDTLSTIYEYIMENFSRRITLNEVAKIANMNPSSFSRFFKRANKKSLSSYLSELRIGYACKLLLEHDMTISSICFKSGFSNVSNFNRQFKSSKKYSPSQYRRLFRTKTSD